jgi:hypothetical protein
VIEIASSARSEGRKIWMFQLINGTIECGECRSEILHGDEFNCSTCGASLCEGCLLYHEDECGLAIRED